MVDFELYRIFVVVAEEENITKASEKLNISQPAVTKHIKNLEDQLSVKLFERKSKGLQLTKEGIELYQKLRTHIEELNKIENQFDNVKSINIGTHNHMGSCIFGKAINEYCLKYPEVTLNLICDENAKMMKMLQNGELDIVFSKKDNNGLLENIKYTKIGYLHDVIIANKNSKFSNEELNSENIEKYIIYTPRKYAQAVERIKETVPNKTLNLRNSSYKTILELASSGNALGLITREYVDEDTYKKMNLIEVKTSLNLGEIEYGIYTNSNRSKELDNLIKIIEKMIKKDTI